MRLSEGGQEWELPPLAAAWLAGQLFLYALSLLHQEGRLGIGPSEVVQVILWEQWGEASWNPLFFSSVELLETEVGRCHQEGIPYRVTLDLARPPADPEAAP